MDQNWLDVGSLVVIGVFFLIGLSSGFVFSTFRMITVGISLFMAGAFYKKLTTFIFGTYVEDIINNLIYDSFRSSAAVNQAQRSLNIDGVHRGILAVLHLPARITEQFLIKPENLNAIPRTSLFEDIDIIMYYSTACTRVIISVFCIIVLYIVIRIVISILKIFLDELAPLKIFKILDFTIAPLFGIIEGVSVVYIVLTVVMLLDMIVDVPQVTQMINEASFVKKMYENNMFLNFALKRL